MADSDNDPKQHSPLERAITVLSYPVSAAAGWYVGDTSVRRSIYTNFAKRKLFEDLQIPETADIKKILESAKIDPAIDAPREIEKAHENYRVAVKQRLENWGFRGVKDYWHGLHRNQKIEAVGLAMTVSGVALGSLLTISNHLDRVKTSILPEGERQTASR